MRRLAIGAALTVGAFGVLAQSSDPAPTSLGGHYWGRLSAAEKESYLTGFLAGAAAEQARAGDSTRVTGAAIDALRTRAALRFRFSPNVYAAQIDDYYYSRQDRLDVPIVEAMIVLNGAMLEQQRR